MTHPNLVKVFRTFPKELFRVNNGRLVKLRVQSPERHSYDIIAENNLVEPKALNLLSYIGQYLGQKELISSKTSRLNRALAPNGASMRPNSPYQQSLVSRRFRGHDMIVYSVAKGRLSSTFPRVPSSSYRWTCSIIDKHVKELDFLTTFFWSMNGQTTTLSSQQ